MQQEQQREITVDEAIRLLKVRQSTGVQKGRALNLDAQADNAARLNALQGECRACQNMHCFERDEVRGERGHQIRIPVLRCSAGKSPLELYRNWYPGDPPVKCEARNPGK